MPTEAARLVCCQAASDPMPRQPRYAPELEAPNESDVMPFLAHTKTFHDVYAPLTSPAIAPVLTFLVSWGHLLIGLSLVSGLLVRVSGVFGVGLLLVYWTAHMDFPYIESHVNLIIDYHIVYATLTAWLVVAKPAVSGVKSRASPGSARAGRRTWADTAARGRNRSPWRVLVDAALNP
jgi:uncharacterized membrane protein YphA (DoxX/SURF4 family)